MKKRVISAACALFTVCSACACGIPSEEPKSETIQPAATIDAAVATTTPAGDATAVTVFDGTVETEIPLHMVAHHDKKEQIIADGVLMFSTMGDYLKTNDVPEFVYSADLRVSVTVAEGFESRISQTVYRDEGEEDLQRVGSDLPLTSLEPGRYVLEYLLSTENEAVSNSDSAIFRLVVEE